MRLASAIGVLIFSVLLAIGAAAYLIGCGICAAIDLMTGEWQP